MSNPHGTDADVLTVERRAVLALAERVFAVEAALIGNGLQQYGPMEPRLTWDAMLSELSPASEPLIPTADGGLTLRDAKGRLEAVAKVVESLEMWPDSVMRGICAEIRAALEGKK